jgi:tetratricopeptide (TPR) repeat protein
MMEYTTHAEQLLHEGKYSESLQLLDDNLPTGFELGLDSLVAENLYMRARCREQLGQYDSALADYRTSMLYAREASDKRLERLNKYFLSKFYFDMQEYKLSQVLASEAAAAAKVFSDTKMLFDALFLSANADWRTGNPDRAMRTISEIKKLNSVDSNKTQQHSIVSLQAEMFRIAGRDKEMRDVFREWKEFFTKSHDNEGLVLSYLSYGQYQESVSHPDSALRIYSQALSMLEPSAHSVLAKELLASLGNVAYQLRQFADAKRYYSEALQRAEDSGSDADAQLLSLSIIACDWKLTNARTPLSVVQDLYKQCGDIRDYARARGIFTADALASYLIGRFEESRNDAALAISSYKQALEVYERHSAQFSSSTVQHNMIEVIFEVEQVDWYGTVVSLYCSQNDVPGAFELAERSILHDQSEFFSHIELALQDKQLYSAVERFLWNQKGVNRLQREITSLVDKKEHIAGERSTALNESLEKYMGEYTQSVAEINSASPVSWLLTRQDVPLQTVRDSLALNTVLLNYVVTPKYLFILVIEKDSVTLRKVTIERNSLLSLISEFNVIIRSLSSSGDGAGGSAAYNVRRMKDLSAELYSTFVTPVLSELQSARQLYIVLPKEFDWIPVHALGPRQTMSIDASGHSIESRYSPFIERFPVNYLPSASALLYSQLPERAVRTVAGFGHPGTTNWDVEYELKDIRSFYDEALMFFDTAATFHNLSQVSFDLLHINAEVSLDYRLPVRSSITLADGTITDRLRQVSIGELSQLPACQVALLSNVSATPGMLARYIPNLMLVNGSRAVIATMWRGDRKAKRYFGEVFYTNLTAGLPVNDAYRLAILSLLKRNEYSLPHRWGLYYRFGK